MSSRDRTIDTAMLVIAVALAALQVGLSQAAQADAAQVVTWSDVRDLEHHGIVHDAGNRYPAAVRVLIGIEGSADNTSVAAVERARETLNRLPASAHARLAWVTIAVALGQDATARGPLARLAADGEAAASWGPLLDALAALAKGRPAPAPDGLAEAVSGLGTSRWLGARLRARHFNNAGNVSARDAALREALESAAGTVQAVTITRVTELLLILVGFLVLLGAGRMRASLAARGFPGLVDLAARSFELGRLQRIVVGWFVAVQVMGWVGVGLARLWPMDFDGRAVVLVAQTLVHAGVAIFLIDRYGRRPHDPRPIGGIVDLAGRMVPGRVAGRLMWLFAGLSMAAFMTAIGWVASLTLFGPASGAQPTLSLWLSNGTAWSTVLLLVSASVVAPWVEELIFRGVVLPTLGARFGRTTGLIASSVLFAAAHLDPERLLPLTALGLVLGWLYTWSASLWVPVVVHGAWNALQLLSAWAVYHSG